MKRGLSFIVLVLFMVIVGGFTVIAFLFSFWDAIASSLGGTTEVEDIHFSLLLYGSLSLGVGTVIVLGFLRCFWARSLPRLLYPAGFLLGPVAYFVSMVYIAPVLLQILQMQNPARYVEGGTHLATIHNAGVSIRDYLAFLWLQEVVTWAPSVLVWLLIGFGAFWRAWLRRS